MHMTAYDDLGFEEAWAAHEARKKALHPNAALIEMIYRGAPLDEVLSAMNKIFAVVLFNRRPCEVLVCLVADWISDLDFDNHVRRHEAELIRKPETQEEESERIRRSRRLF